MNFDRLSPPYDWLKKRGGQPRILVVGEGRGRFVAACGPRFPVAEITVVAAAPAGASARRGARARSPAGAKPSGD